VRDRFGDEVIKNLCATRLVGVAAVESATGMNFNELFTDFTRALVMSGTGDSTDPRYGFTTLNLREVQPGARGGLATTDTYKISSGNTFSGDLLPYQIIFNTRTGDFGNLTLSGTDAQGTVFGLSY